MRQSKNRTGRTILHPRSRFIPYITIAASTHIHRRGKSNTETKPLPVLLPALFDTRGGANSIAVMKADTYENRTRYANDGQLGKQPREAK